MSEGPAPNPPRILVAEDEFLVYLALEEELRANGFEVLGPFTTVRAIHEALQRETVDMALLDINLGGELIYPVADILLARKVPFAFLSGYAARALPECYRDVPRLDKPCDPAMLLALLRRLGETNAPKTELPVA
jgi:DNA-binding response OmpR family regulator